MPSIADRIRRMFGPAKAPPDEPVGLPSPSERGAPDPDPSTFNVGNVVRAAGAQGRGAAAVADERRRPVKVPFVVTDGTTGIVRGVDQDLIFVEIAVRTSMHGWEKVRRRHNPEDDDPTFKAGDRVKAIGPIQVLDHEATIPEKSRGTVSGVLGETGPMDVQVMLHFRKEDWWNTTDPGLRTWGMLTVTADPWIEVGGLMTVTARSVSYSRKAPGEAGGDARKRKKLYREMWYLKEGTNVAVNAAFDRDVGKYRELVLAPNARVLDVSEDTLRKHAQCDAQLQGLIDAVQTQAASIERLSAIVDRLLQQQVPGESAYDAIRTEDRLIVLNPKALQEEGAPKRKRWLKASLARTAEDEPTKHVRHWNGLPLHIEWLAGEVRHADGPFPSYVPYDYGFIPDTEAVDGDSIDVIVGDEPDSDYVYLGVQKDPDTGEFVQFKCLLDFEDAASAEAAMRLMWPDSMVGDTIEVYKPDFITTVLPKLNVSAFIEVC